MTELSLEEKKQDSFELLKYIDFVCRTNDIIYYLAYGTLLGAVRHKGFIPWDDDIDILVPFDQFRKLMQILKMNDRGYILHDFTDTCSKTWGYGMFSKFDNGASFSIDELNGSQMPGICVDIFPLVFCDNRTIRKLAKCDKMNKRMYSYETHRFRSLSKRILYGIWNGLGNTHKHYVNKFIQLAELDRGNYIYFADMPYEANLTREDFEIVNVQFENYIFLAPRNYDKVLKVSYGDYMELPPISERVAHNPIYLKST